MNPRAVVAVILALTFCVFVALHSEAVVELLTGNDAEYPPEHISQAWMNLLSTLVGGLIGYITGRGPDK